MNDLARSSLLRDLRALTPSRVGLARAGDALATSDVLAFQLAHAQARDAVHTPFVAQAFARRMEAELGDLLGTAVLCLRSSAPNRGSYLRRPQLGRTLAPSSAALLEGGPADLAIVLGDGLSALALERHALPLLHALLPSLRRQGWTLAPITVVEGARVAIGDEIGARLGAKASLVLLGERPGLSVTSSLGAYLTWSPRVGRSDAERNCVSNIHERGLPVEDAAWQLVCLLGAARALGGTGVALKVEASPRPDALNGSSGQ